MYLKLRRDVETGAMYLKLRRVYLMLRRDVSDAASGRI